MSESSDTGTSLSFVEQCKLAGLHCENWDDLKTIFNAQDSPSGETKDETWFVRLLCGKLNTKEVDVLCDVCHPLAGVFEAIFRKWRDAYSLAKKMEGEQTYFATECKNFCKSVIKLCDDMIECGNIPEDAKMFFRRLKGDFCRNKATALPDEVSNTKKRLEYIKSAKSEYIKSAKRKYRDEIGTNAPANPNAQTKEPTPSQQKEEVTRQLNLWSVYSDIEGRPRKAINKAKKWLMEKTSCLAKQGSNSESKSVDPKLLDQVRRQIMLWEASIQ